MRPDSRRVRRPRTPLARLRPRPVPPPDAAGDAPLELWAAQHGITGAELRVVHHCVRGLSNKEIAPALGISTGTVRAHLLSVCRKLGISSRGELAHVVFTVIESHTTALAEERRRLIVELERERATTDRERALLDAVLRQSPLGILVVDAATRKVVLANDEVVRIVKGRPADVDEWWRLLDAHHPGGRPFMPDDRPFIRALAGADHVAAELLRTGPDGKPMSLETIFTPIRDRAGTIVAVLGILTDVTRRKAADSELVQAERAAREALDVNDQFVRAVSLDLARPAENVLRLAEVIAGAALNPRFDPGRIEKNARRLHRTAEQLWNYLQDVLALHDIDSGCYAPRPLTLAPAQLIERAIALMTPLATASGVRLESHVAPDLPLVLADDRKIGSVLGTLIDRALHASPPDAVVTLEAEPVSDGVRFTVRDSGGRLSPEIEAKLFDRRWISLAGVSRGYRVSFVVAKEIVQRHTGRIWAESLPRGTAFHFTLPVA